MNNPKLRYMDSVLYSSVLAGHMSIFVICDNGGYAVINRLRNAKGRLPIRR